MLGVLAKFMTQIRFIAGALALAFVISVAAPVSAQQPSSVNPTASSVKEQQLLQELNRIQGRVSIPDRKSDVLEQPAGREWRQWHQVTLRWIGGIAILGMLALLVVFYLVRGQVKLESGFSGRKIVRFNALERFVHWLTASCFVILAISGLNITFGKPLLLPLLGPSAFSTWSELTKYAHNFLSFPFTIGVVLIFLMWIGSNIPNGNDVEWFKRGGGIIGHDHPPAGGADHRADREGVMDHPAAGFRIDHADMADRGVGGERGGNRLGIGRAAAVDGQHHRIAAGFAGQSDHALGIGPGIGHQQPPTRREQGTDRGLGNEMTAALQRQGGMRARGAVGGTQHTRQQTGQEGTKLVVPGREVLGHGGPNLRARGDGAGYQKQHGPRLRTRWAGNPPTPRSDVLEGGHDHAIRPARLGSLVAAAGAAAARLAVRPRVPVHALQRHRREITPRNHRGSA